MIGVDEVGRGCLAGPLLVVAARQINKLPVGVADSKTLSRRQREELFKQLIKSCQFGEGWVKSTEIDQLGLTVAMRLGVKRALKGLNAKSDEQIIMDGPVNYFPKRYKNIQCIVKADAEIPLVSSASIYAKIRRDRFMTELARKHPNYGFESHVGYGTAAHMTALKKYGALKQVHRQLFAPIKKLGSWPQQP